MTLSQQECLVKTADSFVLIDGLVFQSRIPKHVRFDETINLRLYVPTPLRTALLDYLHSSRLETCHAGVAKLIGVLSSSYYWPGMHTNEAKHVNGCQLCIERKAPRGQITKAELHGMKTPPRAFYRVHTDVYGPLQKSEPDGYMYVLTFACALTNFSMFYALKTTTAAEISEKLRQMLCVITLPVRELVMDRASYYLLGTFTDTLKAHNIKAIFTPAYTQRANSKAEVVNYMLGNIMSFYTNEHKTDWPEYVLDAQRAQN